LTSYLLSWLAKRSAGADLTSHTQRYPGDWLVWEPGHWHPPPKAGSTLSAGGPSLTPLPAGEALAIALEPTPGRPSLTLGRGAENDIVIDDATLSRTHLVLSRAEGGGWTVGDAGSSNGSFLDGRRLEPGRPEPVVDGSRVKAGSVRLTFHDAGGLYLRLRGV